MQDICTGKRMKEGVKVTPEQYWTGILEMPEEARKIKGKSLFNQMFDVVDTNCNGIVSPHDLGIFFKIIGVYMN